MPSLQHIVEFCNKTLNHRQIKDFPGAENGLQLQNSGEVSKVAVAVDASLATIHMAAEVGAQLLVVHHGLFWGKSHPWTGKIYEKIRFAIEHDLAIYASHLPLDGDRELGNNAIIANHLGLKPEEWIGEFEGNTFSPVITQKLPSRSELEIRLEHLVAPQPVVKITAGPEQPKRLAICSGSGASFIGEAISYGVDTLITGEMRQHHFTMAQEAGLNLYLCGHYATETFGVTALAELLNEKFDIPYAFVDTLCPL